MINRAGRNVDYGVRGVGWGGDWGEGVTGL